MDPIRERLEQMTRHFFGRTEAWAWEQPRLTTLLARERARRNNAHRQLVRQRHADRRPARSAPFSPQGQAGDLSAYERRTVANGLV